MANELSLTAKLTATKNSVTITNAVSTKTQTMESTAEQMHHTVQEVSTSEEALSVGDVDITNATGDDYFVLLFNRDSGVNYVSVKVKYAATPSYWTVGKMLAGEPWGPVRLPKLDGSSLGGIYLLSSSGTQDVEVLVVEAGDDPTA